MIKDFLLLVVAKPSKTWMSLMMIALALSLLLGNSSAARSSGATTFANAAPGIALDSTKRVASEACENGLEVNISNTSEDDMDAKVCIQLSSGDAKCSEYQQMTQGQKENALACNTTGDYKVFQRSAGAESGWVLVHEGRGWR